MSTTRVVGGSSTEENQTVSSTGNPSGSCTLSTGSHSSNSGATAKDYLGNSQVKINADLMSVCRNIN